MVNFQTSEPETEDFTPPKFGNLINGIEQAKVFVIVPPTLYAFIYPHFRPRFMQQMKHLHRCNGSIHLRK